MTETIKGSVVLITGATGAIAQALIAELTVRGAAKIYAAARDVSALTASDRLVPIKMDVTSDDDVAKAFGFQPNQTATGMGTEPVQYYMKRGGTWLDGQQSPKSLDLGAEFPTNGTSVHGADIITLSVVTMDADGNETGYEGLGFDDAHPQTRIAPGFWVGLLMAFNVMCLYLPTHASLRKIFAPACPR